MKSRGQISLISVTTIIFAMVGLVGITGAGNTIAESVEYNTGDFNRIAASKLKADAYENRTRKEMNHSLDTVALNRLEGEKSWEKNSIPKEGDIKSEYIQKVKESLKEENRVYSCSAPLIDSLSTSRFEHGITAEIEISERNIVCESEATEAYVPVKETLEASNTRNSYLLLNEISITTAEEMKSEIESSSWGEGTGTASSGCEESIASGERDNINEEAESEAINNAETHSIGENIAPEIEKPGFIDIEADTSFDYSKEAVNQETTECTRKVYPDNCQPEEDGCTPVPKPGEEYEAEYEAEVDEVQIDTDVSDTEREILNERGDLTSQEMEFVYSHDIS
jgi:hypothetical protein